MVPVLKGYAMKSMYEQRGYLAAFLQYSPYGKYYSTFFAL